ncbi:MAG: DUF1292 domain-containing protein, partial [Clostridia bacterium]|nr:DUF1292 domain-containing protein [Clostridia bacterium]
DEEGNDVYIPVEDDEEADAAYEAFTEAISEEE